MKRKIKVYLKSTPLVFLFSSLIFTNYVCRDNDTNIPIDSTKKQISNGIKFIKQGEAFFQDSSKKLIKQIDIEIAETDERRHLGLMFRQSMEENQGMLFIFSIEEQQGFYMRNTMIPLDIIFINSKKQIVKIHKNTIPYDETTLPSLKPAMYVLETIGGFSDKFKIKEGDYIDYRRN